MCALDDVGMCLCEIKMKNERKRKENSEYISAESFAYDAISSHSASNIRSLSAALRSSHAHCRKRNRLSQSVAAVDAILSSPIVNSYFTNEIEWFIKLT